MEPPKPEIHALYMAAPTFSQDEALEYERLLAERFQADPDMPKDPVVQEREQAREQRILELHTKIYGSSPASAAESAR